MAKYIPSKRGVPICFSSPALYSSHTSLGTFCGQDGALASFRLSPSTLYIFFIVVQTEVHFTLAFNTYVTETNILQNKFILKTCAIFWYFDFYPNSVCFTQCWLYSCYWFQDPLMWWLNPRSFEKKCTPEPQRFRLSLRWDPTLQPQVENHCCNGSWTVVWKMWPCRIQRGVDHSVRGSGVCPRASQVQRKEERGRNHIHLVQSDMTSWERGKLEFGHDLKRE